MPSKVSMLTLATLVGGTPAFARKPAYVAWVESVTVDALRAGAVELGRTAGIRALRLRFKPAGR